VNCTQNQLLTKKDILEFEMGAIGVGNNDDKTEDALKLPYDRRYEIPQSKFHIGNFLNIPVFRLIRVVYSLNMLHLYKLRVM